MTGPHARIGRLCAILLLTALAAGFASYCYWGVAWARLTNVLASSDKDPIPVCTARTRTEFWVTVPAQGEITGLRSLPIQTPQTRSGGLTVAWLVPEGSFVNAGDIVVRFDSTEAALNMERQQQILEANKQRFLITAEQQRTQDSVLGIDIASAKRDYEYSINVLPQDECIFSKWDIIEAKIDAAFAKERINVLTQKQKDQAKVARADQQILAIERNQAQAEVGIARQTLKALDLVSPAAGLVIYRRDRGREPQIGDQSWRGQILAEVVDLESLQARIYVLEKDGSGLTIGKDATIHLDSLPRRKFQGVLRSVSPVPQPLERNSPLRYFACDVRIRGAREYMNSIRPGITVEAEIVLQKYDSCFVVPGSAVTSKGPENLVYVRQGEDFRPTPVEIAQGPHGQAVILSGIHEGEIIALKNPFEVRALSLPDFGKAPANMQASPPGGRFRSH